MRYAAALSAPWAVEWLTDASPRLVTTTASSGHAALGRQVGEVAEREGQADRARQVGGDGRGLREDVQRRVAEDLVPAAGDRVGGGGAQPEQHVADRRRRRVRALGRVARRAGGVEAAGAVVQQGRVVDPGQQAERRVGLVAGRADRVEALALGLQPAGREVEVPALELGVEERQHPVGVGTVASTGPGTQARTDATKCSSIASAIALRSLSWSHSRTAGRCAERHDLTQICHFRSQWVHA